MPVVYRPAKLLNREKLDVFRAMPVADGNGKGALVGKPALRHGRDIMVTAKDNAAVLKQSFRDLTTALDSGHNIRMIVPINSYALASTESCSLMIAEFRDLPASVRQQVILDVFDFPNPLTLNILDDITIRLMPFFDKLMAEPSEEMDDFEVFANCNYFGVSIDLESHDLTSDDALKGMTKFWAEATVRRLKTIVQGVSAPDLSAKADQYEVFLQDGPYISEAVDRPTPQSSSVSST